MYQKHRYIKPPDNVNAKIWRYMNLEKFISLAEKRVLFFCRADMLGDKYEGCLSRLAIENPSLIPELTPEHKDIFKKAIREGSKQLRLSTYINCWTMDEYESNAMWKTYLDAGRGIAIQSTFARLCKSVQRASEHIYIGKVEYKDYDKEQMSVGDTLTWYFTKRKFFESEKELRALIDLDGRVDRKAADPGQLIPVLLNELIERIYVSPFADTCFKERVADVIRKYEVPGELCESRLNENPAY